MITFDTFIGDYYGSDWAGMILQCISIYCLGNQHRIGFLVGIGGNIGWFVFGILTGSIPDLLSQCIVIYLSIRGYLCWDKQNNTNIPDWLLPQQLKKTFPHPFL